MAKGIVTSKPVGGGGTKGRILLTETATPTGGTGSGTIGGDGSSLTASTTATIPAGTYATFTETISANVGDIVDFVIDGASNASDIKTSSGGTFYTGAIADNIIVGSGESAVVSAANFDGKITVNGGFLVVIENTKAEGKIESSTAGSFIFMDSCVHEGKIEVTGAGTMIVQNSTIEGEISSTGNKYASVTNCIIKGKLEILNATDCFVCKNTVEGTANTPNCRKCS